MYNEIYNIIRVKIYIVSYTILYNKYRVNILFGPWTLGVYYISPQTKFRLMILTPNYLD